MMVTTDKTIETIGIDEDVHAFLAQAGLGGPPTDVSLHPLRGGANNRVFCVDANGGRYLLKAYHRDGNGGRDRLASEYGFARFAWSHGVRDLPQPVACDENRQLGLYTYVEGRPATPADVTTHAVDEALAFYRDVNRHRAAPDAADLPPAAEACFSVNEHLACVDRRIDRLRAALPSSCPPGVRRDASVLVHGELGPLWRRVRCGVMLACTRLGLAIDRPVAKEDRRLSPSDFGFHNTIVRGPQSRTSAIGGVPNREGMRLGAPDPTPTRRLVFIDFEYAGWDDPAKLVCDFFCQPAAPVPMDYYDPFAELIAADLTDPARERRRFNILLPLYRLKWVCILLNEFLADGEARRRFADAAAVDDRKLNEQVTKARAALAAAEASFTARMA
jgi:Phosphotransferase enzyme family